MNSQNNHMQEQLLLCLDDPKNRLQYQLYKLSLVFTEFGFNVRSALNPAIDSLINSLNPFLNEYQNPFLNEYQRLVNLGAENNPRIAFLAYHAKKQRIRNKNLKRLFNIGCRIDIQN